jgi:hypothetical protein
MTRNELQPGEPAPLLWAYEELNIFGATTGKIVVMNEDEELPRAPRGFTWRPLAELSAADLRAKASDYRRMAATARTAEVMDDLLNLAERFEVLADRRERGVDENS